MSSDGWAGLQLVVVGVSEAKLAGSLTGGPSASVSRDLTGTVA
jgi:hypothetical protein